MSGMTEPFSVPITVRGYETDSQGHLNTSGYMQYAELVAELSSVGGLMDLRERRLVDPSAAFREFAADTSLLGLGADGR
jgi:hypothetical protein